MFVQPGQQLMAIVTDDIWVVWVVANFKETQLAKIRPGEPVDIKVDARRRTRSTRSGRACRSFPPSTCDDRRSVRARRDGALGDCGLRDAADVRYRDVHGDLAAGAERARPGLHLRAALRDVGGHAAEGGDRQGDGHLQPHAQRRRLDRDLHGDHAARAPRASAPGDPGPARLALRRGGGPAAAGAGGLLRPARGIAGGGGRGPGGALLDGGAAGDERGGPRHGPPHPPNARHAPGDPGRSSVMRG